VIEFSAIEQAAFQKAMNRSTVQQRLIETEEQIASAEHQICTAAEDDC
jgi:hypothetical protein